MEMIDNHLDAKRGDRITLNVPGSTDQRVELNEREQGALSILRDGPARTGALISNVPAIKDRQGALYVCRTLNEKELVERYVTKAAQEEATGTQQAEKTVELSDRGEAFVGDHGDKLAALTDSWEMVEEVARLHRENAEQAEVIENLRDLLNTKVMESDEWESERGEIHQKIQTLENDVEEVQEADWYWQKEQATLEKQAESINALEDRVAELEDDVEDHSEFVAQAQNHFDDYGAGIRSVVEAWRVAAVAERSKNDVERVRRDRDPYGVEESMVRYITGVIDDARQGFQFGR